MLASRPIISRLVQQTVRRYHSDIKPATMDELPVPSGSWQAHHSAQQRKYNAALVAGVAFTAFTLIVAKTSGLVYFNYSPPSPWTKFLRLGEAFAASQDIVTELL